MLLLKDLPKNSLGEHHAVKERDIPRYGLKNVKTEVKHGKPQKQAVAIALNEARKSGKKIPKKDK